MTECTKTNLMTRISEIEAQVTPCVPISHVLSSIAALRSYVELAYQTELGNEPKRKPTTITVIVD